MTTTLKAQPRIVFFGTPDFAVASLEAIIAHKFNVVAVVTAPDKPAGRGMQVRLTAVKECALRHGLPILQPEKLKNAAFLEELASYKADMQIIVAFRMLPEVVWNMPKMGTINLHGSLLPNYRGAAPINWAIINGEKETGVTTFKLQHEIDTGNILMRAIVPIQDDDNMGTMYQKLMHRGAELLVETISRLIDNTITEQAQDESGVLHHAPKLHKETGLIDFTKTAYQIHNLIRGLSPIPTAYTKLQGKMFKIFSSKYTEETLETPPGTLDTDQKTYLRFATGKGWIYALEVQLEGKKRMPITDFLRGYSF